MGMQQFVKTNDSFGQKQCAIILTF
jgi:hypothetical protein